MSARTWRPCAAVAAALALAAGCASPARRDADRRMVGGDPAGAAAAYESLLGGTLGPVEEDLVLLRAATAHALAGFESGRFARSHELLAELAARYPDSPHRPTADLLRALIERFEAQAQGLAEARSAADELLARTRRQRPEGAGEEASLGDDERLRASLAELQRQLDRQQREARAREAELAKLREEIEMLKAIDLDRGAPPPPPR